MNLLLCVILNNRHYFTIINHKKNIYLLNTKQILYLIKKNKAKKFPSNQILIHCRDVHGGAVAVDIFNIHRGSGAVAVVFLNNHRGSGAVAVDFFWKSMQKYMNLGTNSMFASANYETRRILSISNKSSSHKQSL